MDRSGRLVEMQNDLKKVLEKNTWTRVIQEVTTSSTTMLIFLSESGQDCASVEFNMQGKVI